VPVAIHQSGEDGAPSEVQDRLAGGRVDVGHASRERHPSVADHEGVHHGRRGIHRVNAGVGQQHGDGRERRAGYTSVQRDGPPATVSSLTRPSALSLRRCECTDIAAMRCSALLTSA
jgi:hypothetical protein